MNQPHSTVSATDMGDAFRRGHSPVEELERLLANHEPVNARINALTHVDADGAIAAAQAAAGRFRTGTPLGPLDGVPVSIKELMAVRGWPHSRGSRAFRGETATADSPVVRRLREAGAVLWAQTTSSEFGWKPLGDSLLHGRTLNPARPTLTPGGSGAGAAAVVAAGLGPIAIGTDAAGSVRIPAAFCGLHALKPSRGTMDIPGSAFSFVASAGPLTQSIDDLAVAISAFTNPSPDDDRPPSLRELRVGYVTDLGAGHRVDPSVAEDFDRAIDRLADLGIPAQPVAVGPDGLRTAIRVIWSAALAAVIASRPRDTDQFEPGLIGLASEGATLSAGDLLAAQVRAGQFGAEIDILFDHTFDVLLTPTVGTPPFPDGLVVPPGWPGTDWLDWIPFTYPFNLSGHPAVALPLQDDAALPRSIQLIGPRGGDVRLLGIATRLQQALRGLDREVPVLE